MRLRATISRAVASPETATNAPQPECARTPMAANFMVLLNVDYRLERVEIGRQCGEFICRGAVGRGASEVGSGRHDRCHAMRFLRSCSEEFGDSLWSGGRERNRQATGPRRAMLCECEQARQGRASRRA